MSSSAQIVTRAMLRLRLLDANESPSAADAANGLQALNAMIAGWVADGINVSSDVPLPAQHEEGVVAMLAVRLADDFGATPTAVVVRDADNGWHRLQSAYLSAPTARFDKALKLMPSVAISYPTLVDDWVASTAYVEASRVANSRRLYECIVAGTSASTGSGPQSAGPTVTDGTVTWRYLGETN